MDSKTEYSNEVGVAKKESAYDVYLAAKIEAGKQRASRYGEGWQEVDINDVVDRFALDSHPIRKDGKLYFYGETEAVVADIGGGYLRILDQTTETSKPQYLGLSGEDMHNYIDSNGKTHGRSRAEYNRLTHFTIKKRS